MSARVNIGQLTKGLFKARADRTGQPVRRGSRHAGEFERRRWRQVNMFPRAEHNARMTQLEHLMRSTKMPGKRRGLVGDVELDVYRFLLKRRSKTSGRLDMAIDTIAQEIRRARSAVINALARLKELGFLEWIRRTAPVEDPQPGGQYVQQITNAYFLVLPPRAAELIRRIMRGPSDASRRAQQQRQFRQTWDAMSPQEQLAQVTDPALRASLERLQSFVERASPPDGQNGPYEDKKQKD